jgi:hypothetical protein
LKRPIGIFIAGVFLLVFGLIGLLLFGVGVLGTMSMPSMQTTMASSIRAVACVTEGVFAAFSAFCCWVAIGLFRMRAWARYVSIVLAALGACFFGLSAVMLTLLRNMPVPGQNLPPHLIEHIFLVLALVYFVLAAVGLFWVVYFNQQSIRTAFAAAATRRLGKEPYTGIIPPNLAQHRVIGFAQIVVWIVAVFFLGGGVSIIFLIFLRVPIFLFGWMATGETALLIQILLTCILIYSGLGLLFRWRNAWLLAIALQLYSILSVGLLLVPGYAARLVSATQTIADHLTPQAGIAPINGVILAASSALGGLVAIGILLALIQRRQDYLC